MNYLLALLIIFITIFFIYISLNWSRVIQTVPNTPPPTKFTYPGYGMSCSLVDESKFCTSEYICQNYNTNEPNSGICKTKLGNRCNSLIQCSQEALYCTTVCSETPYGSLNQPAPCVSNIYAVDENNICKYTIGQPCDKNSDCITGGCSNGICVNQQINGSICDTSENCISGNCSLGYCQEPGVITGTLGSSCSTDINLAPHCGEGNCYADFSQYHVYGVCTEFVTEDLDTCSDYLTCPYPKICWKGNCTYPRGYTEYFPNLCSGSDGNGVLTTGTCSEGYSCDGKKCFPSSGVPYPASSKQFYSWENNRWNYLNSIIYLFSYKPGTLSIIDIEGDNYPGIIMCSNDGKWICEKYPYTSYITFTLMPSTDEFNEYHITNIKFTPGRSILITYFLVKDLNYSYRLYLAPLTDSFLTTGIIPTGNTNLSLYATISIGGINIKGIKYVGIEDRISYTNQIKVLVIDVENRLGVGIFLPDQINENVKDPHTLDLTLLENNASWGIPYVFDTMSYNIYEYMFTNISQDKVRVSYELIPDPNTPEINTPMLSDITSPGEDSLPYVAINSQSAYYSYGGGITKALVGTIILYQDSTLQAWLLKDGINFLLPGYFNIDSEIVISIPIDNYSPRVFVLTSGSFIYDNQIVI